MGWLFSAGSSSTLLNCCNNPAMLYELRLCNNDNDVTTALSTCLHVTIAIITKDYVHVHVYLMWGKWLLQITTNRTQTEIIDLVILQTGNLNSVYESLCVIACYI